jgi:hypothetical protein
MPTFLILEIRIMETKLDENRLKQILKEALIEALEEKKDVFHELIVEAIEDIALINAIRQGQNTETVSKQEILDILEGQA